MAARFRYPKPKLVAPCRAAAYTLDLPFYQGRPCVHGHRGVRYPGNKGCIECAALLGRSWKASNRPSERARKADQRRRRVAREALARHELERLLIMRDKAPDLLPVLILEQPPLPIPKSAFSSL